MTDIITMPRTVVEQALEALYSSTPNERDWTEHGLARQALRAALEQQQVEQEPVAWLFQHEETGLTEFVDVQQVEWGFEKNNPRWQKISPVYTNPQPPRQPLTDEQIADIEDMFSNEFGLEAKHAVDFARAIERAHGIVGE